MADLEYDYQNTEKRRNNVRGHWSDTLVSVFTSALSWDLSCNAAHSMKEYYCGR